ncbi:MULTISPECIES: acyltransferase [unclassified Novosphingobium]|uniref:acyltransferase family protein n=1 Tax=unclassified Novosphingobium TaxID=2644732 RepID=UPI00146E920F|nr:MULTISPECIES: acyltransferase [unclassified Novosphingobium]NMN07048.1 peptidoglycan/LPS O-acetylase OafA/YrhL [Novosphingobium sp. SG919]NMN89364.1 peptidoglycan/LPS O-acetylase OafA/YrhL [Novosphingobium sp. SG916]
MKTFGDILERNNGFGPGFDFARVFLAISVLLWHVLLMSTGGYQPFISTPAWIYNYSILPMFFGLSGFLVAGSAQRNTLKIFAINRGIRIFPALIVEIALSALILGPIFTNLPLGEYFTNKQFYIYFLNMIALINFKLPGVFLSNPYPGTVNGSLWTVPFEFLCYFAMAFVIVRQFINQPKKLLAFSIFVMVAAIVLQACVDFLPHAALLDKVMKAYIHDGKGSALLPCFLLGALAYTLRYKIPMDWRIFLGCLLVVLIAGIMFGPGSWKNTVLVIVFAPVLIYIVCFVGLLDIPKLPYFSRGDYSYGIYLYGFPIQQALAASSDLFHNPWIMLAGSLAATTAFATFSWHCIESPILRKRKAITAWLS